MTDFVKPAMAILGLLLVVLFAAWLVLGKAGPSSSSTGQTDPQGTSTPDPASRPAIPQLDTAESAGAGTAGAGTATFALG